MTRFATVLAATLFLAAAGHPGTSPEPADGTAQDADSADDLNVLKESDNGVAAGDMMKAYLRHQVLDRRQQWEEAYEQRTSPEMIAAYQERLRAEFMAAIGELPERTPLNATVMGLVQRDGYRVENVIFESQPQHFVTAALYVPESSRFAPPYPAVLVACGHSHIGKAHDSYQKASALLALNGIVALCFDPIDQGERMQLLDDAGEPRISGTKGHTMAAIGSILLGRGTATYEIWDGMRAIDYLQERPEVDPDRIGCMGNSGGGTQTSYLLALDDRVQAASPSCYITNFSRLIDTIGVQDAEQNVFGQLAFGMDHADFLMMRAPTPILICAATQDFFDIQGTWDSFRRGKRLFTRLGHPERIDLMEDDKKHNYDRTAREAAVGWMTRWLDGRDDPVNEGAIEILSDEEIQATPDGQVMLIPGSRSVYDINRELESRLGSERAALWSSKPPDEMLDRVRSLAGIRPLEDIPSPAIEEVGTVQRGDLQIRTLIFHPEEGIRLPALLLEVENPNGSVLYLTEDGKQAGAQPGGVIERMAAAGLTVLAVDLRGIGETAQTGQSYFKPYFGADGQDVFTAYLLGRSYVGMRTEDVLTCARWLREETGKSVHLKTAGSVGVPALHAAALKPQLFASFSPDEPLRSWSELVDAGWTSNQLVNTVHGALRVYDLPDLDRVFRAAMRDR